MEKRVVKINVNGKYYEVEVSDLGSSPLTVTVNGKTFEVMIEDKPPAADNPPSMNRLKPENNSSAKPRQLAAPTAAGKTLVTASANEIRAPMPGVILDIAVKTGDQVAAGQTLCALEAMKMKSAIRSPRAGTIASIAVHEGQKVSYNDLLVQFE